MIVSNSITKSDILLHGKAQKPLLLKTMPAHNIGSDGNFAISTITGKGVFLSAKTNGRWFSAGKMEELKTFDNKTIDNISTKILKVRKEISMGDSFKLNSNSLSVSTGDFAINSNENVLLNSDTAIDGDLDINGIQTITSKTKLINGLMSNPNLNLKYDDKNYVKFGTIKSGGLQIEPYKVDDVSGVTVGPIKLMYDETYYTTFQNDSSGNFTLASTGNATLDVAGNIVLNADGGQVTIKDDSTSHFLFDCNGTQLVIYDDIDSADLFRIRVGASGATTIATVDDGAAVGHLTLTPDGDLILDPISTKVIINASDKLYFDGGGDTYIFEQSNDYVRLVVGGVVMLGLTEAGGGTSDKVAIPAQTGLYFDAGSDTYIYEAAADELRIIVGDEIMMVLDENGADGNNVNFRDASVGFTRVEATFSATGIIGSGGTDDTDIDFRFTNKYRLEMTGDITTINLIFPGASGNFLLVCTTNGDHDVSNWKAFESDESAATTADVMWAGGSVPAFTNSGVDIVSFYWDADEQQAYGVASLAFATP